MISIIIIDCFKQKHLIEITQESVNFLHYVKKQINIKKIPAVLYLKATPVEYYYFYKEITNWDQFINLLLNNSYLLNHLLVVKLLENAITTIDYKWSKITYSTLMEKIESEHLFSWLSTLGGGYSALGDNFQNCAKIAAKISLQQLALCYKLGDPNMQARCKLFYSISLIQQGKLKLAKHIIQEQYRFAKALNVEDTRLVKMCKGIWLKLQHSYRMKRALKSTTTIPNIIKKNSSIEIL